MKIVQQTDSVLVLEARPWVSMLMHAILGFGFLVGFLISVALGDSLFLTLGMAFCLAMIIRIFLFDIETVSARFDRTTDQIDVRRARVRRKTNATRTLSDITDITIGHDRDGDADRVVLHFGADDETLELPASANSFIGAPGQAQNMQQMLNGWLGKT